MLKSFQFIVVFCTQICKGPHNMISGSRTPYELIRPCIYIHIYIVYKCKQHRAKIFYYFQCIIHICNRYNLKITKDPNAVNIYPADVRQRRYQEIEISISFKFSNFYNS